MKDAESELKQMLAGSFDKEHIFGTFVTKNVPDIRQFIPEELRYLATESIELNSESFDSPIDGKEIGKQIAYAMNKYSEITGINIDKSKLAELLNLSASKINSMLNGNRPPRIDQLINLAKLLHVSTDYLLGLEDYSFDLKEYNKEQEITGLSQLSIFNLRKYKNSLDGPFELDSLFGRYIIKYTVIFRNEPKSGESERIPNRFPCSIFTLDYSKSIPDMAIEILNLPKNITYKLIEGNVTTIASLISLNEKFLKDYVKLSDEEINTVEESAQKYFNVMFGYIYTKTHPIQTCGTLREKSIENRSKDLFFLNSIIEDETTFLSIEHFANILYNLKVEMEINTMRINCFDKVIEDIERKKPGSFEDYSESDKK